MFSDQNSVRISHLSNAWSVSAHLALHYLITAKKRRGVQIMELITRFSHASVTKAKLSLSFFF